MQLLFLYLFIHSLRAVPDSDGWSCFPSCAILHVSDQFKCLSVFFFFFFFSTSLVSRQRFFLLGLSPLLFPVKCSNLDQIFRLPYLTMTGKFGPKTWPQELINTFGFSAHGLCVPEDRVVLRASFAFSFLMSFSIVSFHNFWTNGSEFLFLFESV